ncbi:hypothetical protein I7I50_01224 [Histoplasma capsulatum G186AR]|uniref:Uncharacterized protein n=1 Tax=Ajellomyces capsulatus TaxID=5037 RepID=A0A8H7Z083_AJECA|nr:hypothetical protein I7I52_08949 [Histoplasma capsulatum]QSS73162.1 hypothetical protein I7I50_01224 [Histoplasma capsulatum G186AR]
MNCSGSSTRLKGPKKSPFRWPVLLGSVKRSLADSSCAKQFLWPNRAKRNLHVCGSQLQQSSYLLFYSPLVAQVLIVASVSSITSN